MNKTDLLEKKLSILEEISSAIVLTGDISSVANLMVDLAVSYCNAEKGSLMLLNDKGELYIHSAKGIDVNVVSSYRVRVGSGIAGTVALNREPVLVEDIEKDDRFGEMKRDRYKSRSFISCPVISKNKLLGVINVNDKIGGSPFIEDEFDLMKIIGNHAAIALENVYLVTELKSKAMELEELNRKLIESDVMKTEFIARVSHEFRTPLNSIQGAIYYLQQARDSMTASDEFYELIDSETEKLARIVDNLLEYLRTEDESKFVKMTVINVADTVRRVLDTKSVKETLSNKNIRITFNCDRAVSDVVGDKVLLNQMFINLLEGMVHYLDRGDSFEITCEEERYVSLKMVLSKVLPEKIVAYLSSTNSIFNVEKRKDLLKFYLARNIIDVHRWEATTSIENNMTIITIRIPEGKRKKKDAYINTSMDMFVDFVSRVLDIDICSIMLNDEFSNVLTIKGARGLDESVVKNTKLTMGEKIAGWVALEGRPLFIEDIEEDERFQGKSIEQYTTKSLLSLPLKTDGKTIGVLNLNNKKNSKKFTLKDYYIGSALGARIAQFISRIHSDNYCEDEFNKFLVSFENLLDAKKKYSKNGNLVSDLLNMLLNELKASDAEKEAALYVSMIYDLGMSFIDDEVMSKAKLSPSEIRALKVHPYNTLNLIEAFEFSEEVKRAILHHHERYDGKGYPDGLHGEEIPFMARVLSVVDSFSAMIREKPYGERHSKEQALKELEYEAGIRYDPGIVDALIRSIDRVALEV